MAWEGDNWVEDSEGQGEWQGDNWVEPTPKRQPRIISGFPARTPDQIGSAEGLAGSLAQGATAGWSDELMAGPMALYAQASGDAPQDESVMATYKNVRDSLRNRQKQFSQESPIMSGVSEFTGAMVPLTKAMQGANLAKTAAMGGGYAAGEYLGKLDEFSDADILQGVAQTGIGAALPAAVQRGGEALRTWVANRKPTEVQALLRRLTDATGASTTQLKNRINPYNKNTASLADISGTPGTTQLQAVRGAGDMKTEKILEDNFLKTQEAKDRIRPELERVTGKTNLSYFDTMDDLITNRKARAELNYGDAIDNGTVLPTKRMLSLLETNPTIKDAWRRVQQTYAENDLPLPQLYDHDKFGKAFKTEQKFPNMRAVQELKWELDKQRRILSNSVDSTGKKELGRLNEDYYKFMDDVNKQNPKFAEANRIYAGDSALIMAQEMGKKHGLGGKNIDAQIEYIKDLKSSGERSAYLQGLMSDTYGKMGTSKPEDFRMNFLESENARTVMEEMVGKKNTAELYKSLGQERRYREVKNDVMGGSQTQPRQVATDRLKDDMKSIPLGELMVPSDANKVGALRRLATAAFDKIKVYNPKISMKELNQFTKLISQPGGAVRAINFLERQGLRPTEAEGMVTGMLKAAATAGPAQSQED